MSRQTLLYNVGFLIFLAFLSEAAHSTVRIRSWDTGKTIDFNDGLDWINTGSNVSLLIDFCVRSTNPNTTARNYQLKVANQSAPSAAYALQAAGFSDLPLQLDLSAIPSTGYESLSPNQYSSPRLGSTKCGAGGGSDPDNARLRLTILNADLQQTYAATYTRTLVVTALGGTGSETASANLNVRLVINPYTRISNLNDILFPTWDGINSLISSDSFCVYRNSPGNYNVLAQGSGPAYAFSLTEGISQLPYTATWNDLNTTTNLSANVLLSNRTNTFTTNQSCNGGANNNATIELTITPAAINSVPQGIYSGTMTMIISQQ